MIDNENDQKGKTVTFRVEPGLKSRFKRKVRELDENDPEGDWSQHRVVNQLLEDWLGGKRKVERADPSASLGNELLTLQKALDSLPNEQRQNAARMISALTSTLEGLPQNPSQSRTTPKPKKKAG